METARKLEEQIAENFMQIIYGEKYLSPVKRKRINDFWDFCHAQFWPCQNFTDVEKEKFKEWLNELPAWKEIQQQSVRLDATTCSRIRIQKAENGWKVSCELAVKFAMVAEAGENVEPLFDGVTVYGPPAGTPRN